jgi:SAM-dependent methyltransferase
MTARKILTDRIALERHRRRAAHAPALFLHAHVADEVKERLIEVNRSFTSPAIVTAWPDFWAAQLPDAHIVPDNDVLDLRPDSHDLVLHVLSLHWANDPVGQLIQCRLALRPDGLMIAVLLGGRTLHELRSSLAEAEARLTGGLSPRVAPMGEIRDLGALLQRAGLALPVADHATLAASYGELTDLMRDLRMMGEGNALTDRRRGFTRRGVITEAAKVYGANFADSDGRLQATFDVITLTGWAPSSDQPQPLRPGSATQRLAAALGTTETPLRPADD